jgi:transcriptional regulator with XRE-family HTH domain
MPRSIPSLLPRLTRLLAGFGERLKQARLRRAYSAETIAERAGINRKTLGRVEQGDPAVSFGVYVRVLQAVGLDEDVALLARDDELGRRLQDMTLKTPRRAPRKKSTTSHSKSTS